MSCIFNNLRSTVSLQGLGAGFRGAYRQCSKNLIQSKSAVNCQVIKFDASYPGWHHIYDSQGTIWYFPSLFIDPDNKVVSKNVTQDSVIDHIPIEIAIGITHGTEEPKLIWRPNQQLQSSLDISKLESERIRQTRLVKGKIPEDEELDKSLNSTIGHPIFKDYTEYEISQKDAVGIIQEVYDLFREEVELNQKKQDAQERWNEIML